jgi:hypothetical protein
MMSGVIWEILANLSNGQTAPDVALSLTTDLLHEAARHIQCLEGRIRELEQWQEDRLDYEARQ